MASTRGPMTYPLSTVNHPSLPLAPGRYLGAASLQGLVKHLRHSR